MSALVTTANGALPAGTPWPAAKPALDASNARAAGAAWQSVFDRAHADDGSPHDALAAPREPATSMRDATRPGTPRPSPARPDEDAPPRFAGPPAHRAAAARELAGERAIPAARTPWPRAVAASTQAAVAPSTGSACGRGAPAGHESDAPRASASASPSAQAASLPDAGDCASVFVHDGAVAVVVRDAALDTPAALRDAFAAARELTGAGGSLERLVLNGRPLYRRPAPADEAAPRPGLSFAC